MSFGKWYWNHILLSYRYNREVFFAAAHSDNYEYLQFYVSEKVFRAIYSNPNDPVYKTEPPIFMFLNFLDQWNLIERYNAVHTTYFKNIKASRTSVQLGLRH